MILISSTCFGRNYRPKHVELIKIINKSLLLHLVGYLYYWQMGFNSVFKGLINKYIEMHGQQNIKICCLYFYPSKKLSGYSFCRRNPL